MSNKVFRRTKYACYFSYLSMSSAFCVPPLLFVTFHELYGISYTLLGTLVLINFCTQLIVDLLFSFFANRFNVTLTVRVMPLMTSAGLLIYAAAPILFPGHIYAGLALGTVIFSVASGLSEVIISPIVAAIPSDDPGKDMSLLHSLYGWGLVTMVLLSSVFFLIFGTENWSVLLAILAVFPLGASLLYFLSPIPELDLGSVGKDGQSTRNLGIFLCFGCIFLGSCAENTMSNWISGYIEQALNAPKAVGDVLGVAMFAALLATARTLYAKIGKNIIRTIAFGMAGTAICYLTAGLSGNTVVSFIACALTGFCSAMLWPGTLIMMEENISSPGVAAYALMAAGGDLGASVAPQLLGILVDKISVTDFAVSAGLERGMTPEQIGLRYGILTAAIFPIIGSILVLFIRKFFSASKKEQTPEA